MDTVAELKADTKFEISVIYNGLAKTIVVNDNETVQAVLQHAIHEFGSLPNPHILALFTATGVELNDQTRVKDAGINPGDKLLLRPSTVRGG